MSEEFPFISAATETADDLPLFKEYAWDFETDKFRYDFLSRLHGGSRRISS